MNCFMKRLNFCGMDPHETLQDTIDTLVFFWDEFGTSETCLIPLYSETVLLVLSEQWIKLLPSYKTQLQKILEKTSSSLPHRYTKDLCQSLIHLIKHPWEDPTLVKILRGQSVSISEALELCLTETPRLLSLRLHVLCAACEYSALRLTAMCLKCLQDPQSPFLRSCSPFQIQYWNDVFIALLHSLSDDSSSAVLLVISRLSLEDGSQLIDRFLERGLQIEELATQTAGQVWRNSLEIARIACQHFLEVALNQCPIAALSSLTLRMVKVLRLSGWSTQASMHLLRTMVFQSASITSGHMYMVAGVLFLEFEKKEFQPLCIELLVRGSAIDLNYLEQYKMRKDQRLVELAEMELALTLSALAEMLVAHVGIHRECVLSAFSLHPTPERFSKLLQLQGVAVDESLYSDAAASSLGVSRQLIDDLPIIFDNCRWQMLNWNVDWSELEPLCRRYLADKEATSSVVTHLKYLTIDYSQFSHLPRLESDCGIEPGFEDSQPDEESQESLKNRKRKILKKTKKVHKVEKLPNKVSSSVLRRRKLKCRKRRNALK